MITRRGFIGSMLVAPAVASFVVGTPDDYPHLQPPLTRTQDSTAIELLFDGGSTRVHTPQRFCRTVFMVLDRHLRDLATRVVGAHNAWPGDRWGSGCFDTQVFALLPDLPRRGSGIAYDRIFIESLGAQLAQRIRLEGVKFFGNMERPYGLVDCVRVSNSRLSLRFLTHYDVCADVFTGRFDVIGTKA